MKHRISVGALIVRGDTVLMVNHKRIDKYDFWVAPGGGIKGKELMKDAVIREVKEETGFDVCVGNLLYIEEMFEPQMRMVKFWYQCDILAGQLDYSSPDAKAEYIIDAKFMTQQELLDNEVFPLELKKAFWQRIKKNELKTIHLELREMEFY
jgi:8-oxo-dGTP diphosphatase